MNEHRTGAGFNRGKSKQDYETPLDFLGAVKSRFGPLKVDLACTENNKKAPRGISADSLSAPWHKYRGLCWLNPPYDNIAPWAKKCRDESKIGAQILFLVPASIGSNWFKEYLYTEAHIIALNGRLHFDPTHPTWGYPKDCILACFRCFAGYGFEVWDWRNS